MYALVQNGVVVAYPYSDYRLRQDNPNVSFPAALDDTIRAHFGVLPVEPTEVPYGKRSVAVTAAYAGGFLKEIHALEDVPLEELRREKLAALAARRWQVETGGVMVAGALIRTDDTSQGKITGADRLFERDPELAVIDWEAQPGVWVTVDRDTMTAIGIAVGRHVQACFSRAKTLSQAIMAAEDAASLAMIDIEQGWPA